MPSKNIGKTLKELRLNAKLSQKQAYEYVGVAQSTFSSWEIGKAEPPTDILLKLCQLYRVDDVLTAFGYDGYNEDGNIHLNLEETEIIEKYRELDEYGIQIVNSTLDIEVTRSRELRERKIQFEQRIRSYSDKLNKPLLLNAAHERTDIEVTDEMRNNDDDIMDDENF